MDLKIFKVIQAIVFATFFVSPAISANVLSPLPAEVTQRWHELEYVGQASLRRFGFHIYDATLWMASNRNDESYATTLSALSITYAKNIRAKKLLSSTKKEWRKLGITDKHPTDKWINELQEMWPDVKKGDQLIVIFEPGGNSSFYNKYKKLGTIEDADFGPAFLSIWLHKNASFKNKRKQLLGVS